MAQPGAPVVDPDVARGSHALGGPDPHDLSDGPDHQGVPDHHDDDHGPAEDPRWVLLPLLVGLVIGLVLAIVFGLGSGVPRIA